MYRPVPNLPLHRRAFTLIETALATVIVGVGIVAGMQLFSTCTVQNHHSADMTTALFLTTNLQEVMAGLPLNDPVWGGTTFGPESGEGLTEYNDLDDFDGQTFSPPIDSQRETLSDLSQFFQLVTVVPVYVDKLSSNSSGTQIGKGTYTGAVRVTVRIFYRARPNDVPEEVLKAAWVRTDG